MLAVLEFYANAQNWETVYAGSAADGTQGPDFTPIDLDRGRRGVRRRGVRWRLDRRCGLGSGEVPTSGKPGRDMVGTRPKAVWVHLCD